MKHNPECLKCPHYRPTKKQDQFNRLRALWYLLLKELVKETGYSEIYWKEKLKKVSAFYISIKEPDGSVSRELMSVANGECTLDQLSKLFTSAFIYIVDNQIISVTEFMNRYFEITGRELIN